MSHLKCDINRIFNLFALGEPALELTIMGFFSRKPRLPLIRIRVLNLIIFNERKIYAIRQIQK